MKNKDISEARLVRVGQRYNQQDHDLLSNLRWFGTTTVTGQGRDALSLFIRLSLMRSQVYEPVPRLIREKRIVRSFRLFPYLQHRLDALRVAKDQDYEVDRRAVTPCQIFLEKIKQMNFTWRELCQSQNLNFFSYQFSEF